MEWSHAIAPGANILVVEANSQGIQDLMAAVDTARSWPGVVAVSMSWGFSETPNETSYDANFTTPANHQGVTFVASSGDNGSFAGASYPAASPNVLSVGGTTLVLSSTGAYQSESAWIDSGGGYSQYEPEPSYQAKVQTTGYRATPDVAFDGDPNTGVPVYVTQTTPFGGSQGSWLTFGGTSLGSPAWAGIIAITDQGRALAGLSSLDGPTQTLPALYAAPSSDFHTVAARFLIVRRRVGLRLRRNLVLSLVLWKLGPRRQRDHHQHVHRCEHSDGARLAKRPGARGRPGGEHPHDPSDTSHRQWRHDFPDSDSDSAPKTRGRGIRTSSSPHPPRQPHDQVG